MSADALLQRLDRVHARGRGQWSARCPAHDDKGPSLSVKETAEGAVLVHCFAGCNVDEIVRAVGFDITALFPPKPDKPGAGTKPSKLKLPAAQALDILTTESMVIAIVGGDLLRQKTITETDHRRLIQAVARVQFIAREAKR